MAVFAVTGRDRRYSGSQGMRQRATRSSRDLLHGEDMEAVMADALVSWNSSLRPMLLCKSSISAVN